MLEIILVILGSTALAALINQIGETYRQKKRGHSKEYEELHKEYAALRKALMYVILDRIRFIGQDYIKDGEIDFDDRRLLNEMHEVYHDDLNGNGDLDALMKTINSLPLKTNKK